MQEVCSLYVMAAGVDHAADNHVEGNVPQCHSCNRSDGAPQPGCANTLGVDAPVESCIKGLRRHWLPLQDFIFVASSCPHLLDI